MNGDEAVNISDAVSILRFCDTSHGVGQIILASGILDMGIEFGSFSHEVIASSEQIPCRPHFGRIGISHRDHASSEKDGDLLGIDLIVFGLSAVNSFHVKCMPQDERDSLLDTQIGDPACPAIALAKADTM